METTQFIVAVILGAVVIVELYLILAIQKPKRRKRTRHTQKFLNKKKND